MVPAWLLLVPLPLVLAQTDYSQYLQPDDIISGAYDDLSRNPPNVCARNCGGPPKICYWNFNVQLYVVMGGACGRCPSVMSDCFQPQCVTADGVRRNAILVNRRLPGPSIQVCLNDTIIVDVHNQLIGKQTTLHWHGILQRGTPWMDGVYMITQCPITPGQTFRYIFKADRPGTHYWHDHSGLIKFDGTQSSMVVREVPTSWNNMNTYDFDLPSHTLFLQDWKHFMADQDLPVEQTLNNSKQVDTFLINGKGVYITNPSGIVSPSSDYNQVPVKTPLNVVQVRQGFRYRLRIVGGTCMTCGVRVSVDRHKLLVIASDGDPMAPREVDYVTLLPGERFDVVLRTNQAIATYWMIVQGTGACSSTYQLGVVRYVGSSSNIPQSAGYTAPQNPMTANAVDGRCNNQNLCINELRSTRPPPSPIYNYQNNVRFLIQFGFYQYNLNNPRELYQPNTYLPFFEPLPNIQVRPLINNISFPEPPSPMLTQLQDIPSDLFCTSRCKTYQSPKDCMCLDPIRVPLNRVLDLIIVDTDITDGLTHPFHMHGHVFYVLEVGLMSSNYDVSLRGLMRKVETGQVPVNNPPGKDTITILNGGYAIVRVIADNPGMWFVHCHFLYHHLQGMSTVMWVGESSQFPRPPAGFPQCKNFYYS